MAGVALKLQGSAIKIAVEKGPRHFRQSDTQKNPPLAGKLRLKPFFDSEKRFGFNVPPGWTETDSTRSPSHVGVVFY